MNWLLTKYSYSDLVTHSINNAVCRTAPATQGLIIKSLFPALVNQIGNSKSQKNGLELGTAVTKHMKSQSFNNKTVKKSPLYNNTTHKIEFSTTESEHAIIEHYWKQKK